MELRFSKNILKKFNNGVLIQELPYNIQLKESIIFGEPRKMLIYKEQSKQSFIVKRDTLTIFNECYDCFVSKYKRSSLKQLLVMQELSFIERVFCILKLKVVNKVYNYKPNSFYMLFSISCKLDYQLIFIMIFPPFYCYINSDQKEKGL